MVIDGEVRGLAIETFTVLEGSYNTLVATVDSYISITFYLLEVFIEFQDVTYLVVEDNQIYSVTIVRQGEPGEDIIVTVNPNPDPTSSDSGQCKGMAV